jgi:hypothetical protein
MLSAAKHLCLFRPIVALGEAEILRSAQNDTLGF